jgi:NADH dehydrogenase [ubiquinone] 1 alpha subcomplex assembly factor 1
MRVLVSILALMLICHHNPAAAHKPTMSDGTAVDAAHAIAFEDIQISRVVYHEVTEQAPRIWITFEVDRPQELFLQIGVPHLERLRAYRPTLLLLGPGLPPVDVPFEHPSGVGGVVLTTRNGEQPRKFYEPFTGTRSWILREEDVRLPRAGRYYVVAFDPDGQPGKLWAATGRQEVWGAGDLLMMPKIISDVRRFHEAPRRIDMARERPDHVIFDFGSGERRGDWLSVNDDVMGGVSKGTFRFSDEGLLEFRGEVSLENNGGFASIRSQPSRHDLSEFEGLLLRVRGDGHRYACTIRTDYEMRAGSYQARFQTTDGQWEELPLRFRDFTARSFGTAVPDAPPLDTANIRSIGFSIADKQAGPFALDLRRLDAIGSFDGVEVDAESARAGCATCVFNMPGVRGCVLAVKIDGSVYLVQGSDIDAHGDAHAPDGLCNAVRRANAKGVISGDRFVADELLLLP